MSGERESLWGVQRRKPVAHDERVDAGAGGTPKERRVLDLQQQAGNSAVTGAVQRSIWGDDDSWLGGVGSMFPALGGGGGATSKGAEGPAPMMGGFGPDTAKVVDEGPHGGPGAGLDGGAGALGGAKSGTKDFESDEVGPAEAAAKGYGENEVGEDDAGAKGYWDGGFDTSGNEYKDPVGPEYENPGAAGGAAGGGSQYGDEYK